MNPNELRLQKKLRYLLNTLRMVPDREPQAASRGKAHFLEEARTLHVSGNRKLGRPTKNGSTIFPLIHTGTGTRAWNALMAAVLAFSIFLGGSVVTVYAAQESVPYDALYPIKTLSEDVLLSLPASPQRQLDLALNYTDRRLFEISVLLAARKPIPQNLTDRFQNESYLTLKLMANMNNADLPRALDNALSRSETEIQALAIPMTNRPADPVLMAVEARLQEQVQLLTLGKGDPQGFRLQIVHVVPNTHGTASSQQKGNGPTGSIKTPIPDAGSGHKP